MYAAATRATTSESSPTPRAMLSVSARAEPPSRAAGDEGEHGHAELLRRVAVPEALAERKGAELGEAELVGPGRPLDDELEAGVADEPQVVGSAQPVLEVERRVHQPPRALGEAQEVVARKAVVEVRVVVLQVDAAAEGATRPQQAEALAEDRGQVVLGDVLADVRAGDEVDGLGGKPGRTRVAGGEVLDPEALFELREGLDRIALQPRERIVHELDAGARPDVDEHLPPDAERRVRQRDREIPADAELVEDGVPDRRPRPVLLVRRDVLLRAGELSAEDRLAGREAVRDVALEEVVQALPLRDKPQATLERRFRHPPHRAASIARPCVISTCNLSDYGSLSTWANGLQSTCSWSEAAPPACRLPSPPRRPVRASRW